MTVNENPEKATRKQVPISFILAAVAALLLLIAAFFPTGSGNKMKMAASPESKMAEEREVVSTTILLHKQFSRLQKLDGDFNVMLFTNDAAALRDSLSKVIETEEKSFAKSIDSFRNNRQKYNAWANVIMIDSITNTFTNALANRKFITDIKKSLDGKSINIGTEQKDIMLLQADVRSKENRIASLESLLKSKPVTANVAVPESIKEMETALKEEEMRNAGLLDIITELKKDNAGLISINKSKKTDNVQNNITQELREEISDLNAELSFARIDCNLSRADAKKIISNSKQRMQLLEEALKNLQTLAGSDNAAVKRKAKEKLAELSSIASTVRD